MYEPLTEERIYVRKRDFGVASAEDASCNERYQEADYNVPSEEAIQSRVQVIGMGLSAGFPYYIRAGNVPGVCAAIQGPVSNALETMYDRPWLSQVQAFESIPEGR